jgi:hypothetical protein
LSRGPNPTPSDIQRGKSNIGKIRGSVIKGKVSIEEETSGLCPHMILGLIAVRRGR